MEFIKVGKNYMIKNSNGRIVSKKEKELLEKKELVIEEEHCKECEIKVKKAKKKKTATSKMEVADGINKETNTTI
jgi:maltodextrin utilization protein YvdJ